VVSATNQLEVRAGPVIRPAWRRLRFWVAIAVLLVLGAVAVTGLTGGPPRPLDPASASKSGSKALAVLLGQRGVRITRTTDLAAAHRAGATVVVARPDAYSTTQLAGLRAAADRVVLIAPPAESLAGVGDAGTVSGPTPPDCDWPGAVAAGTVDLPETTDQYSGGAQSCYGGAVLRDEGRVVLGSAQLLQNRHLGDVGVAALDINAITDDGAVRDVIWLLPGAEATGVAARSYWELFPDGARRAFWWLLLVGVLLVLWQGRRFGPVVSEPLPVVVRAAEVIEGHGRLYRRAGARDRAAAALRAATTARLVSRLGLQRAAALPEVAAAVAHETGRVPADVAELLAGRPPADDAGLLRLAGALDALEAAAGVPARTKGTLL
jgi:hypothetical protein